MRRTRIKFCGFTRGEDVQRACDLGVDAIGFVFAARSPRRLDLEQALSLRNAVAPLVNAVALFMDNPADEVAAVIRAFQPDVLQFHGAEDDAFCAGFGLPHFKTIAMGQGIEVAQMEIAHHPSAEAFLLDGHAPGQPGGRGESFDWSRLPDLSRPWLLAGGLTAANVAAAIERARPYAVDVSSGIESAPGLKDSGKMQQFINEVRRVDQRH